MLRTRGRVTLLNYLQIFGFQILACCDYLHTFADDEEVIWTTVYTVRVKQINGNYIYLYFLYIHGQREAKKSIKK